MDKKPKTIGYSSVNLPTDLVEELKIWRQAFGVCQGRPVTYAEMFRMMLDDMDSAEPDVVAVLDEMAQRHPELAAKIGRFNRNKNPKDTGKC